MILEGKAILVTGAGSGIGRGIAQALAKEGANVIASDLAIDSAEATVEGLVTGAKAIALGLDVTDSTAVAAAVADAVELFGSLDGLVNNAGVLRMQPALESGDNDWVPQFEVNSRAVLTCCQAAAKQMIEQGGGGAIVNVASNAGKVGYPNMAAYNASKAAVISLTRSLASEWAAHGINVNAVCPGGVATPMLDEVAKWVGEREGLDPRELAGQMYPAQLGRHVAPIEVGRVVAFLLSDRATIIRGQSINVDGGDTPY